MHFINCKIPRQIQVTFSFKHPVDPIKRNIVELIRRQARRLLKTHYLVYNVTSFSLNLTWNDVSLRSSHLCGKMTCI